MKKKILLLILVLGVFLVGCGQKGDDIGTEVEQNDDKTESMPIVVVSREDGSGTRGAFIELTGVQEKLSTGEKTDRTTEEAVIQMKTDAVMSTVGGDKNAIGYISVGSLNTSVKALKVDGFEPNSENIESGDYKLVRPFNIATKETTELSEDFIKFILSNKGQEVVSSSYIKVGSDLEDYESSNLSGKIVVAGSSSVTPIMEKLKEEYVKFNPDVEIEVQLSDSSSGLQSAVDGLCDIAMASRELKAEEKEKLTSYEIAFDGIAVIVNNENEVEDLSVDTIKNIFTGDITNWNQIEGK